MKLTQAKLSRTLKKLADDKSVYQARKVVNISIRRVYQVKEAFDKTGEIPKIGNNIGRSKNKSNSLRSKTSKKQWEN